MKSVAWGNPNTLVWGKSGMSQDEFGEEKEPTAQCRHSSQRSEKMQHKELEGTGA